jgi:hypothetical protein
VFIYLFIYFIFFTGNSSEAFIQRLLILEFAPVYQNRVLEKIFWDII